MHYVETGESFDRKKAAERAHKLKCQASYLKAKKRRK